MNLDHRIDALTHAVRAALRGGVGPTTAGIFEDALRGASAATDDLLAQLRRTEEREIELASERDAALAAVSALEAEQDQLRGVVEAAAAWRAAVGEADATLTHAAKDMARKARDAYDAAVRRYE